MTRISIALCALALLGACAKSPFDRDGGGAIDLNRAGGAADAAIGAGDGSANDPTSPAFFQARVGDRVLFSVNESDLTPSARQTLDGQAEWLVANAAFAATIEGHADEQGTRDYNLALGGRRANAVRDYLITRGVPAGRLRTTSFGKERPIEVCSDESCYSRNRRAVTVVSAAPAS